MKIASIAFTENGAKIVKMLVHEMDVKGYVFEKYKTDGLETFNNVSSLVRDIFKKYNAIVFVGACGIAVRSIAPYVKDKAKDPAVVVVDEKGNFAIPILSGHIGGANDLAEKIAALTFSAHTVIVIKVRFCPAYFRQHRTIKAAVLCGNFVS